MFKKNLLQTKIKKQPFSPFCCSFKEPALISKTINIYSNATNWSLYNSPGQHLPKKKSFVRLNVPSRFLNVQGFCWEKGYRTASAFFSYKTFHRRFLEALHLCVRIGERNGKIHVIFDGDQFTPSVISFRSMQGNKENRSFAITSTGPKNEQLLPSFAEYCKSSSMSTNSLNSTVSFMRNEKTLSQKKLYSTPNERSFETPYSWSGRKWVGGTVSNFKQVSKSYHVYKTISRQFLQVLENCLSPRYYSQAKKFHGNIKKINGKQEFKDFSQKAYSTALQQRAKTNSKGITKALALNQKDIFQDTQNREKSPLGCLKKAGKSTGLPDLIIIENAENCKNIIAEAEILKIPVIAFVESDLLSSISIALPVNTLKHYFLAFLLQTIYKIPNN